VEGSVGRHRGGRARGRPPTKRRSPHRIRGPRGLTDLPMVDRPVSIEGWHPRRAATGCRSRVGARQTCAERFPACRGSSPHQPPSLAWRVFHVSLAAPSAGGRRSDQKAGCACDRCAASPRRHRQPFRWCMCNRNSPSIIVPRLCEMYMPIATTPLSPGSPPFTPAPSIHAAAAARASGSSCSISVAPALHGADGHAPYTRSRVSACRWCWTARRGGARVMALSTMPPWRRRTTPYALFRGTPCMGDP